MTRPAGRSPDMSARSRRLVVSLRPGASPRRAGEVARWIRALLPAAILLVGPAAPLPSPGGGDDEVITIDADAVQSGPLAIADAIVRQHGPR